MSMWSKTPLVLAILAAAGCTTTARHDAAQYSVGAAEMRAARALLEGPPPAPEPAALSTAEFLYADSPELAAAVKAYQQTGKAPAIKKGGVITYPYGEGEPIVTCEPLLACDVELQAGEEVLNVALGDSARWLAAPATSGQGEGATPHVILKPIEAGISTNAVITTTRRTYHLGLVSKTGAKLARQIRFYYPADAVQQWAKAEEVAAKQRANTIATSSFRDLNFDYEIKGDAAWRPYRVFDDGRQTVIQMPAVQEAPALFVMTPGGEQALVNYRVRNGAYVVDRLFSKARLVLGVGGGEERIEIRNARLGG